MTTRSRIAAGLLASTMLASPAFAQDSDVPGANLYEEDVIIVQATRRSENVQDVPIAVTVVTPEALERQGVVNIKDLSSVASGFNLQSSQTETQGTSIRIRGVGTTGNNIGLESAVGVFIDGVYQSRPGIALGELVDIEAIEMLRGPQGTLFGRNVTAGALNVRTRKPEFTDFNGFANFTYGNYDLINVQGGVNIPVSDTLALRATGSIRDRDGFMESSIVPGLESQNRDRFMLRGQALWEPTDNTSLRLIADFQDADELCCAAVTLSTSPNLSDATRDRIFPNVGFDQIDDRIFNDQIFENSSETTAFSAELNHDFGAVSATLIGSYSDFKSASTQQDFNGGIQYTVGGDTISNVEDRAVRDDIKTYTAELRFQGEAFDDRLDWLVGGFYANESILENFTLGLGPEYSALVGEANFGGALGPGLGSQFLSLYAGAGRFIQELGAGNPTPTFAPLSADGLYALNIFEQDAESFSIFTHNVFAVTDTVNLTLGGRYVDDSKDGSFDQTTTVGDSCLAAATFLGTAAAAGAGDPAAQGAIGALTAAIGPQTVGLLTNPALIGGGGFLNCFPFSSPAIGNGVPEAFGAFGFLPELYDDNFSDEEFIYTAKLGWEPTSDLLLFASLSHGYKAGGFNLDASAGAGGADPRFNSEEIDSYEIGFKSTIADGRLRFNMTGFYQTMDDFQVLEFTGTRFQTFNVQDVSSKGFEAELNGRLADNFFINAGLTYADAAYGDDCDIEFRGTATNPALGLCGDSLTNAPKVSTVLGGTYDGPLFDSNWGFLANVNLATQSSRRTSTRPQVVSGGVSVGETPFDDQNASTKVNARIGFTLPSEAATIEFWGTNLTDVTTRGITFNTPLQAASRSAFLDAPRQYGATLRTRF